jgi:hypothetical protein
MNLRKIYLVAAATLLALAMATAAGAAPRMYTGSLIILSFGNTETGGATIPFIDSDYLGIPLTGLCNTEPYHPLETLMFKKQPPYQAESYTFTIPVYGGAVNAIDTNTDTIPDRPVGCLDASLQAGDPLTGSGTINTTGDPASYRATSNPRAFSLPQSELNKVKAQGEASFNRYGVYLWEVHFADLHNKAAVFAKSGGNGSFAVVHSGIEGTRKATATAGAHKFGGVMKLLGIYGDYEGYFFNSVITSVFYYDWLFDYMGEGGQATTGPGNVTKGYIKSYVNYGYTREKGYPATSTVYAEVFKWTTGTVGVTAIQGTYPTRIERKGYDSRTAMGAGVVQLVSPMLSHWVGAGESSTAAIGIMKIEFVPEPSSALMLGAGAGLFGLLVHLRRRSRR